MRIRRLASESGSTGARTGSINYEQSLALDVRGPVRGCAYGDQQARVQFLLIKAFLAWRGAPIPSGAVRYDPHRVKPNIAVVLELRRSGGN